MGVGRARDTCERLQAMTPMGSSAPQDLAEVYRTTYRALVRFLYRKVWDAERAEDLAQEARSEEHTSELQSLAYLVCRLLLEKKKKYILDHTLNYSAGE